MRPDWVPSSRSVAKTVLRGGVGAVGSISNMFARGHAVRVLMYHRIDDDPTDPFTIPPARFARQAQYLADHCDVLDFERYEAYLRGELELDRPGVLITFDDGYASLVRHALPILQARALPAVLFASTRDIDEVDATASGDRHLTWTEVCELQAGGVAVGSHGWRHVPLARLDPDRQVDELRRSVDLLSEHAPGWVPAFAYPYGIAGTFDDTTEHAVQSVGLRHSFRAQHGAVHPGAWHLAPRTKVDIADPKWLFGPSTRGALDGWAIVDRLGSRAQQAGIETDTES